MHEYSLLEGGVGGGRGEGVGGWGLSNQSMIDDAASDYEHRISTLGPGW